MNTLINGRSGNADIVIAGTSYKTVIRRFDVESNVPQNESMTLSTESAPTFDPGVETLRCGILGYGKYGDAPSGPLIPAPQNVSMALTYAPGCSISAAWNFTRASISREAGANSIVTGEAISSGPFVVVWNRTTP